MGGEKILDCRGLACPQPVIKTKETLEGMPGGILQVMVDNEAASINVWRFAESQGHRVQVDPKDGDYIIEIKKEEKVKPANETPIVCSTTQERTMVVYISSEGMGKGDEKLGQILMTAYLDTLSQFAKNISHLIFVNAGVKLAVEGSPVLEQIEGLKSIGVEVLSCGTCLNFFGLLEKLRVGSVTNMMVILETLSGAGKILSP